MANFLTRHFNFLSNPAATAEFEAAFDSLSDRIAFKRLAMFIATSYISNAISKCEIKVFDNGAESKGDLYYRLNVSPNPNQCGSQMVNMLVDKLCSKGEALVIPHMDKYLFVADSFHVNRDKHPLKDHLFESVVVDGHSMKKTYKASDVFYFRLNDTDVSSIINSLYEDYGKLLGAAIDGFRATRGRKYKLVLDSSKVGDKKFNDDYQGFVKDQLTEFMNNPNAIYPQFKGYDLQEMKHETAGDSGDIIAMRKEIFDTVAQAYKIPSSMMYGNMTNTNDVVNQFLTFAVDAPATLISDEMTRKSFGMSEWKAGSRVEVDTKRINHVDIFNVASGVERLISSGTFSIDMVLESLGYQPLKTEFSRAHFITKNYSLAEEALRNLSEGGETK